MTITYQAAFCFQNAADTATFSVPGALPLTPPSLLQNPHTSIRCRVESDTMVITGVLAGATSIDTLGLFGIRALSASGLDLTSSIVSRMRVSLSDLSAVDGAFTIAARRPAASARTMAASSACAMVLPLRWRFGSISRPPARLSSRPAFP
jgi:hypothetical protein